MPSPGFSKSVSDQKLNEAFIAFNNLKLVLCDEPEMPFRELLPHTGGMDGDEVQRRKAKAKTTKAEKPKTRPRSAVTDLGGYREKNRPELCESLGHA